ncbi:MULTISPECIES: hypothetical protein [Acinetobacter]|jgi:hypothetical protein|uniref:hypothetical protein n=5 Tax=Moraxellaceae TaxID=468 RepID=UPI001F1CB98D|nr:MULTISPECIES: hypothetical protein [Acinetobacter]UIJ77565.1 hypothetical protein LXF01_17360 [Acinetobacter sp. SH20PTE14]
MAFKEFNMRIKNLAQIFIIITLLTGCIAKSQPVSNSIESVKPIIFIKHANSGSRVTITGGKLHVDPYGCIRLGSDTGSFIIWANNHELEYTKDGRISITNKFNNHKVFIGNEIILSGGPSSVIPKSVTRFIPEVCSTYGYWIASPL